MSSVRFETFLALFKNIIYLICSSTSSTKGSTTVKKRSGPPCAQTTVPRDLGPTEFRRFYDRGDLPIILEHRTGENGIHWKYKPEELDYHHFLPIFFEGLRETVEPYQLLAKQGIYDMLEKGGRKILDVIPQLIFPIKSLLIHNLFIPH